VADFQKMVLHFCMQIFLFFFICNFFVSFFKELFYFHLLIIRKSTFISNHELFNTNVKQQARKCPKILRKYTSVLAVFSYNYLPHTKVFLPRTKLNIFLEQVVKPINYCSIEWGNNLRMKEIQNINYCRSQPLYFSLIEVDYFL